MKYTITMSSGKKYIFYNDIDTSEKVARDIVKENWYVTDDDFNKLINVHLIESIVCEEEEDDEI